jgi:hypothetical protein
MKSRAGIVRLLGWAAAVILMLLPASLAFAQDENSMPPGAGGVLAALAGFMVFFVIFGLAIYVYMALAFQTIAQKTNTPNAWWAWIPILNLLLVLNIAKKPIWWIILFFIPLVGIIVAVIVLMAVAEARNKPSWWGIMFIIPVMNLIAPGYLAWAD